MVDTKKNQLVLNRRRLAAGFAAVLGAAALVATPAAAGAPRQEAEELVADAAETALYFAQDSAFETLWNLADDAKAFVIVPEKFRAGFIFGGSAGDAVLIARNKDGSWSQPTFMTIGSFSFGFQAGGEASEIVLAVMTQRGMEHLLSTSVKLGADISIAAGPIGAGAKAKTTDILAFSRSRGLYGGVSLEGSVLKTRVNWNTAYYNADVSPAEVVYRNEVYNPASAQLQSAVWRLANRNAPAPLAPAVLGATDAPAQYGELDSRLEGGAPLKREEDLIFEDDAAWGEPIERDPS